MKAHWVQAVVLGAILASGAGAWAQETSGGDDLFAGTDKFKQGSTGSSEVTLDKSMLGFAGKGVADKMDSVYVRSYDYPHAGMYKMADVEQFENKLDKSGCKHIVRAKENDEVSDVCVKADSEGHWREMFVISADPTELSFVHLTGTISLDALGKLGSLGSAGKPAPDPKLQHR